MPGHPEAQKARAGLYEALKDILKDKGEISFLAVTEAGRQEVFIGGLFDEPVPLSSLMLKSMAEIFTPKFTEYFERKNLSSFSLKAAISKDEFEKFINIMTESPLYEEKEVDVRERLTMGLIKNEILMVSTVFNVDLVGKGRKLPWRVQISLSRLKKDLNMIPLYKNISKEKKNELRRLVFEDIVRPLNSSKLIKEMLANLDLISIDLVDFDPKEFETKIIEHLNEKLLPEVSRKLLDHLSDLEKAFYTVQEAELQVRLEDIKEITKKICKRLIELGIFDEGLFYNFIKSNILAVDEIPDNVRNRVLKHLSLDSFLESPEKFYAEVEETLSAKELRNKLLLLFEFLPVLFSGGRYKEILEIFKISKEKGIDFEITENIENIGLLESVSEEIYKKAERADKEEQLELLNVLSSIGKPGTYLLVNLLDNGNRFVRRFVLDVLPNKGPEVIPFVIERFNKKEGWYYIKNALVVLSKVGVGDPEVEEIFKRYLYHSEPSVRTVAIQGITNILGEKGEGLILPLLKDENADVRKRAAFSLGSMRSTNPGLLSFFVEVLTDKTEDDTMLEQVINTIVDINISLGKEPKLEDALINMLKEPSILGFITRRTQPNLQLRSGTIKALGILGTSRSLKVLEKYISDENTILSKAASEAVEKIKRR